MNKLLSLLLLGGTAWAACSTPFCSVVLPTSAATASIATSNFGSTKCSPSGASCMSHAFFIHDFNWTANVSATIVSEGGYAVGYLGGSGITNAIFFNSLDTVTGGHGNCDVTTPGGIPSNILVLGQRDVANMIETWQVWKTQNLAFLGSCTFTITSLASDATIKAQGIQIGGSYASTTGGAIAFARWNNFITKLGVPPPVGVSGPAAWLDYEFDPASGNLNDTSGIGGQNLSGSVIYADTPIYSPFCSYFPIKSFAIGTSAILDASNNCIALNGSPTLAYAWTYQVGADGVNQGVSIVSPASATTQSSNLTRFGSANFQLVVTDSSSNSSTVVLHYGAVAIGANNSINLASEGVNSVQQRIAGPQVAWGHNPWTFGEDRMEASLNLQLCNLLGTGTGYAPCGSQFYAPFWRIFAPGTIMFTSASNVVVGSGTTFKATFGGGTTTPVSGANISWKYTGVPDGHDHYTHQLVTSIIDDTHLTTGFPYPTSPFQPWPACSTTCSGISYGEFDNNTPAANNWLYTPAPGNYYDVEEFAEVNRWRSGSDYFWTLAQTQATYFMEWPILDFYSNCYGPTSNINPGNGSCFTESRSYALTGMILFEQDPGNSYLLPAIENLGNLYVSLLNLLPTAVGLNDLRDDGYNVSGVSGLALADPNYSSHLWQNTIKNVINGAVTSTANAVGPGWQLPYTTGGAEYTSYSGSSGCTCSVATVNGSPNITGTGTAWASDMNGQSIWLYGGGAQTLPPNNAAGDAQAYIILSVNSPTSITLMVNYTGTTGSGKGFFTGVSSGLVGWGFQPFMEFHWAQALYMAMQAMHGFDTLTEALAKSYAHIAVTAAINGIAPDNGGVYNGLYYPGCPPGMLNTSTGATLYCYGASGFYPGAGPTTPSQNRTVATEAMRAIALDYQNFGTNFSVGTLLMNQMFCAPGFTCPGPADGFFLSDYLDGGTFLTSQFSKWTGELGGYTGGATAWGFWFLNPTSKTTSPSKSIGGSQSIAQHRWSKWRNRVLAALHARSHWSDYAHVWDDGVSSVSLLPRWSGEFSWDVAPPYIACVDCETARAH